MGSSGPSRSLLVFCSVLSLIAGALIGYFTPHPRSRPITVATPEPTPTPTPTPTPAPLRVYVCGAVQAPDVYLLPPGSLVRDAVRAAGGPAPDADLERINLARELQDQQQIYVPRRGEETPVPTISEGVPTSTASAQPLINVNTATAEELQKLPRVGPALAQRIVAYREMYGPFKTPEDLMQVPGIGEAIFAAIRDFITVGP
ncbi:MAG: ComEA family DNA-binding protein [Thermoflexales bacterium]|nr:ComEA family DNA-binding protein [Thermoflexales bacterium]